MRRSQTVLALAFMVIALSMIATVSKVGAITYGSIDEDNVFSNVGAFIVRSPNGQVFPICSGTLIAPGVFLTASHCTVFYVNDLAPRGYTAYVSLDKSIPFGDLTSRRTQLIPVLQVVTNPNYNPSQSDSGDIAVLIVSDRDTRGITPAKLPRLGLLDQLAAQNGLQDAVFIPVGYGLQNRVVGGGVPFFQDVNPIPRMFAFSGFNALNGGYLRLTQNPATGNGGTCFGDSGGPNFFNVNGEQILAAITITGDSVCRSTNVTYRTDTASSRAFLSNYLNLP
ncbi:MAG: S1 family peptidase [Blastocatellia bacterium]